MKLNTKKKKEEKIRSIKVNFLLKPTKNKKKNNQLLSSSIKNFYFDQLKSVGN